MYAILLQKGRINKEEQMLGLETQTEYRQIDEIAVRKEPYDKLWSTAVTFHQAHDKWMNGPLVQVNAEDVEEGVSDLEVRRGRWPWVSKRLGDIGV